MNYLVLCQYREQSAYNDFIGKFYHFPKKYLSYFPEDTIEFIYYEPLKSGKGEYFGCGKINKKPFPDNREQDYYFIEIDNYRPFAKPVSGPLETPPYYNPQNSVRKIDEKLFEEICLDGHVQLNFTTDAHLVKVLGEQLIATEKVGILELIKNSYDARATYCKVKIEKVDLLPQIHKSLYEFNEYEGPVIVIEDDGIGMTREIIEDGWLRPASTIKTNIKEKLKIEKLKAIESGNLGTFNSLLKQMKKEYKNRIPLGEKGIGRFATHRLGKHLIIKTKVKDLDYETVLIINWDDFDKISDTKINLDSIKVNLSRQNLSRDYGKQNSGTQIIIFGGREGFFWNEKNIVDLNESIIRLNSPNPHPDKNINKFKTLFECPQLPDLPKENITTKFEPIFTFEGLVDKNGILDYKLKFQPPNAVPMPEEILEDNKFDLKKCDNKIWLDYKNDEYRTPKCGPLYLHLEAWYRDKPWIDGPDASEFKKYLDQFGGISIYRDGINVFPAEWGAEIDWLQLKTRHIKQGFRISYYNFIGNLEIDQIENFELIDKTDREGIINNQAYKDLTDLVYLIITNVIENQFRGIRDKYYSLTKKIIRDPRTLKDYTIQSSQIINNINENYPVKDDPHSILKELGHPEERKEKLINIKNSMKNLEESLDLINENIDRLSEHAGFGLSIAVSIHEIAKITSNFYYGLNELLKRGKLDNTKLKELQESSSSLKSELKRLAPLRTIRSEKKLEFNILKPIEFVEEIFRKQFEKLNIKFILDKHNDFNLYTRYGAIVQIFSNLIDNSCYWLEGENKSERKIIINIDSEYRTVTIADTGPGIHKSILPYIFQSGYSLKIPPSGLGLYICKYYMQIMRGDVCLTDDRLRFKEYKGAQFTLNFKKVAENKEGAK